MAEARAAVDNIRVVGSLQLESIVHRAKLRGPQLHTSNGGLVIVVPAPQHLVRLVFGRLYNVYHHFQRACWPAPVWAVTATFTACMSFVIQTEPNSWFRSGPIASALWDMDERFVGFLGVSSFLPTYLRIAYLAGYSSLACMLVVALVSKMSMRLLLNYQGWMFERKPSIFTLVWSLALRSFYLGQRRPLTYSFQSALPRQPVPPLKETIRRYLETIRPLISQQDFEKTSADAARYLASAQARRSQALLVFKAWFAGNYVSDWWEKYVYLRSRAPLLINSNYYGLGYAYHVPSKHQTARAAVIAHHFARFKILLEAEQLAPTTMRGTVPVCMRQYERMFGLTRIPGRDTDWLHHSDSVHVAVSHKGVWWRVDLFDLSDDKSPLSIDDIKYQLDVIVASAAHEGSLGASSSSAGKYAAHRYAHAAVEARLPALTAIGRTRWAEIREDHFSGGLNKMSLDEIETAMFVVNLDDRAPSTWTEVGTLSLHGGAGATWWCDKSFNINVFANGEASMHVEHSWADAPVMAHAWEWVLCHEHLSECYDKTGALKGAKPHNASVDSRVVASQPPSPQLHSRVSSSASSASSAGTVAASAAHPAQPVRLEWQLHGAAGEAVLEAATVAEALCSDLDLQVDCIDANLPMDLGDGQAEPGYGKGFIKKQGCGPDAWIQMALQLAYFRDQGELALTYESAAVRLFNEGRTETIRSVSMASKELLHLMHDPSVSPSQKIQALQRACQHHQGYARDAACGKGVDRHLFALYVASMANGGNGDPFLKAALSIPYKLSTSQIPQRQTDFKVKDVGKVPLLSPSGGFGPVSDQGYGVAYMMADDDRTFFHVSSKHSCTATNSARFQQHIKRAFHDLRALYLSSQDHASATAQ